jgi:hypothetical protein
VTQSHSTFLIKRVSITGYTETNRDYLRSLLLYSGAVFDPVMDKDCTHLICAG